MRDTISECAHFPIENGVVDRVQLHFPLKEIALIKYICFTSTGISSHFDLHFCFAAFHKMNDKRKIHNPACDRLASELPACKKNKILHLIVAQCMTIINNPFDSSTQDWCVF